MNNDKNNSSLDDLLTNIESQYQQKTTSSFQQIKPKSMEENNNNSIDNYLDAIQSNLKEKQKLSLDSIPSPSSQKQDSNKSKSDELLNDIAKQFQAKKNQSQSSSKSQVNKSVTDDYLANLSNNFQAKKGKVNEITKEETLINIRQEEINKQRYQKELTAKAKQWLKNLDPNSDEGFWFTQFAESYDSKLDAAIDYLKALS